MNGLDKIIAQILDDAKQESLAIREKAAGVHRLPLWNCLRAMPKR